MKDVIYAKNFFFKCRFYTMSPSKENINTGAFVVCVLYFILFFIFQSEMNMVSYILMNQFYQRIRMRSVFESLFCCTKQIITSHLKPKLVLKWFLLSKKNGSDNLGQTKVDNDARYGQFLPRTLEQPHRKKVYYLCKKKTNVIFQIIKFNYIHIYKLMFTQFEIHRQLFE